MATVAEPFTRQGVRQRWTASARSSRRPDNGAALLVTGEPGVGKTEL